MTNELRVPNTLATCVTKPGCFGHRGVDDASVRRGAESHRKDTGHEVDVVVLMPDA